ncbi:uncharacterized protein [Nicotiana sylvestris]|uniref:uncharacterized protein n=1 Tax=Nicotiana sylvestris TaxID=4096 RepID=UPI00388C50D5
MENENVATTSETDRNSPTFTQTDFVLPPPHPFYLHPSDNPDTPSPDSPLFKHREQCNNKIITWILNSLEPDISQSVIYSKSAKSLWDELNQRYEKANGAKMYEVQKDLSTISQGSSDVGSYFTRVERLWDEMESLDADLFYICECKCGGKHKMIKKMENHKLMQFLMGLNEVLNNARGNILMMQPLPEVGKAYFLVVQDEKQRGIHNVPGFQSDSAAFSARYCKKPGHVIEKCYKLHRFPQPSKSGNKNIRVAAPVHSSSDAKPDQSHENNINIVNTITLDQYKQLMTILQHVQVGFDNSQSQSTMANFADYFCGALPPSTLTSIPVSPNSAVLYPAWQAEMLKEFEALELNKTWDIVPLHMGKKPIGNK